MWYERMARYLARRGVKKSSTQTPQEFVRIIEDERLRTRVGQFHGSVRIGSVWEFFRRRADGCRSCMKKWSWRPEVNLILRTLLRSMTHIRHFRSDPTAYCFQGPLEMPDYAGPMNSYSAGFCLCRPKEA